jgi:serine O-acetyltransferase
MDARHLDDIISELTANYGQGFGLNVAGDSSLPDRPSVRGICDLLLQLMFPGFFSTGVSEAATLARQTRHLLVRLEDELAEQIYRARCFFMRCTEQALPDNLDAKVLEKVQGFLGSLAEVRDLLATDVDAAYANDPAASGREEVIVSYPCIEAIAVQRLANRLYRLDVPFLPRMMTEVVHSRTGIDIHPGATIGPHFFIDHGTGVVIGETTTIGSHCTLYHGVTLGAFNPLVKNAEGKLERGQDNKRHPDLEDHVTVYPGATILGGDTRVGHHSVIGGNAWLTESVPPFSRVTMADPHMRIVQKTQKAPDFAI